MKPNELKCYNKGFDDGMQLGKAIGRFYEKHNITDKIPEELQDEYNEICGKELNAIFSKGG